MFASAADHNRGLVVWIFSGSANADADYEEFLRSLEDMVAATRESPAFVGVIVADPGRPVPSPQWRRRLAEASSAIPREALIFLVSRSVAVRGAVTAIHWVHPPRYHFGVHDTFASALAFVEEQRGRRIPVLQELHARARAALQGLSVDRSSGRWSLPPASPSPPPVRRSLAPPAAAGPSPVARSDQPPSSRPRSGGSGRSDR